MTLAAELSFPRVRQSGVVRALLAAVALVGVLGAGAPALASCVQLSLSEKVRMADVIAHGTIDQDFDRPSPLSGRTVTFRALRVLKGSLRAIAQVRMGPDVPAGPRDTVPLTSVDYRGTRGEHVLYLRVVEGTYETNDCSGSHPGPPTPDEGLALGGGTAPDSASPTDQIAALGVLPLFAAIALVALITLGTLLRRARRGA